MPASPTTTLRRPRRRARIALVVTAAVVSAPTNAFAGTPRVIFSNIQSSLTSDVPGLAGVKFYNGPLPGTVFGPPHCSPDGARWLLRVILPGFSPMREAAMVGAGLDSSGAEIVLRSGTPTFFDGGLNYGPIRLHMGIDNAGAFAIACDSRTPPNSDNDEIVIRWIPDNGFSLMAREHIHAPGQPPGVGYGSGAGDVHMLDDGRVAFGSGGLTGSGDDAVFINSAIDDGVVLIQNGVTVPLEQLGGAFPLDYPGQFRISADGETYAYTGVLTNGRSIVAVNNVVVSEGDRPLPDGYPGFFDGVDIFEAGTCVSPYHGHFAFRCRADFVTNLGHTVIVDDAVVAATYAPITPGSNEFYFEFDESTDPFNFNVVNSHGDYLITGSTDGGPPGSSTVVVLNGRTVILRGGDLVDLDGDGLANDGVRLGTLAVDSAFLTDNGRLFFAARLLNMSFQFVGDAFLWLRVPRPGDTNCDGAINFFDIDPFLLALFDEAGYAAAYPDCWRITADINRDGDVNFFDIDPFIACLFDACP